jgi:hypothetical protein
MGRGSFFPVVPFFRSDDEEPEELVSKKLNMLISPTALILVISSLS